MEDLRPSLAIESRRLVQCLFAQLVALRAVVATGLALGIGQLQTADQGDFRLGNRLHRHIQELDRLWHSPVGAFQPHGRNQEGRSELHSRSVAKNGQVGG